MEALQCLRIAAGPSASYSHTTCQCSRAGRSFVSSEVRVLACGAERLYRGVSVPCQRRDGVLGKWGPGRVVSVFATNAESLDVSGSVKDRKQFQQSDIESRGFTITEIEARTPEDWHPATVFKVEEVASGIRCISLNAECSRELVKLDDAYRQPGQLAKVKVGGKVVKVPASSPPVSDIVNDPVLYKIRGDIPAGMIKLPAFSLSAKAPVDLHVTQVDSAILFNLNEGDDVELGPWEPTGLDLRPILFLARYPTMLLFAQGRGIAVARALLEAKDADTGSLHLGLRADTRLYYWAPKPSLLAYKDLYSKWEEKKSVKVRTIVQSSGGEAWDGYQGSFSYLWDEDDIEYDPISTAVVVAVESSKRKEVRNLLAEAGIPESQIISWDV